MKSKKKGFILYLDYSAHFDLLTDEQAGQLIKLIFDFEQDKEMQEVKDPMVKMAFSFISQTLLRDKMKYEDTCKVRQEAGKKGGRPNKTKQNQTKAKKPNGYLENQTKAKKPDIDIDIGTDIEIGTETKIDKEKDKNKKNIFVVPDIDKVKMEMYGYTQKRYSEKNYNTDLVEDEAENFYTYWEERNWKRGNKKIKSWVATLQSWVRSDMAIFQKQNWERRNEGI